MGVVTLDLDGMMQDVQARAGDTVVLLIAENPTTGFLWRQANKLPPGVMECESEFIPGGPGIGSGGTRRFAYFSDRPVTANLEFHLNRPWEGDRIVRKKNASVGWV